MAQKNAGAEQRELGPFAILVHLGLLIFGIAAWLTGDLADDYKNAVHAGYAVHSWIGMGLAVFASVRLITGLLGPKSVRFTSWLPVTKARLELVREDIAGLLRFRLPERPTHQGLAGVVQTFGLAVFLLMAATGGILFFELQPGQKAQGLLYSIKTLHEIGEFLIPVFLLLHVGAVVMHALRGRRLWRKILFLSDKLEGNPKHTDALTQ